jgi:hypothetical protein
LNISFSVTSDGSGTGFFRDFLDTLLRGKKPAVYRSFLRVYKIDNYTTVYK